MPKASYHWFKLWHEIIDDPKMAMLPDRLWRRAIELMAIASKTRQDTHWGRLPPVEKMAWMLRMEPAALQEDLVELESRSGVVQDRGGRWYVTNFDKRQVGMTSTERSRRRRDRQYWLGEALEERSRNDTLLEEEEEEDAVA